MKNYAGRPTALTYVPRLSKKYGFKIYLKREDLLYGGAHKLNNTMGQALLAKYLGKTKLIAETGAGQHGFPSAITAAYFGKYLKVFRDEVDINRRRIMFTDSIIKWKNYPLVGFKNAKDPKTKRSILHLILEDPLLNRVIIVRIHTDDGEGSNLYWRK